MAIAVGVMHLVLIKRPGIFDLEQHIAAPGRSVRMDMLEPLLNTTPVPGLGERLKAHAPSQPERIVVLWRQGLSGEFNGWLRKGLVPGHTRDNGARRCVNLRIGKVTKGQARRRECGLE